MNKQLPDWVQHRAMEWPLAKPAGAMANGGETHFAGLSSTAAASKSVRYRYLGLHQQCSFHVEQPLDACPNLCLQ